MFDPQSRYHDCPQRELQLADGRPIAYVRTRRVPEPMAPGAASVEVTQDDRVDSLAARVVGDPEQFWRLCDAAGVLDPAVLIAEPGGRIAVPRPGPLGGPA